MTRSCVTHYIFGFQIQVDDGLPVHVVYAFAYLSNEQNAIVFGQCEIIGDHTFEQFAAGYTESEEERITQPGWIRARIELTIP